MVASIEERGGGEADGRLRPFTLSLLEAHLSHCVAEAQAKVEEASDAIARLVRS